VIAKTQGSLGSFLFLAAVLTLGAAGANAYPFYDDGGDACVQCHDGFVERGLLHDLHVGSSQMTNSCLLCHTAVGDDPHTDSSGDPNGLGCSGCHMGPGLRLHHLNADVPAGPVDDLFCEDCHTDDPIPPGEDVLPPYYVLASVNLTDPCETDPAFGGEDYSGDDFGLDNDGDLDYDIDDADCGVATTTTTTTSTTTTTTSTTAAPTTTTTAAPTTTTSTSTTAAPTTTTSTSTTARRPRRPPPRRPPRRPRRPPPRRPPRRPRRPPPRRARRRPRHPPPRRARRRPRHPPPRRARRRRCRRGGCPSVTAGARRASRP